MSISMFSLSKQNVGVNGVQMSRCFRQGAPVTRQSRWRVQIRAQQGESIDTEKLINDIKARWDKIENKTNIAIYGAGAVAAIWASSTVLGAINSVPLLGRVMELVGVVYTSWFVYRYVLFKSSREELSQEIEQLKSKISGASEEIAESTTSITPTPPPTPEPTPEVKTPQASSSFYTD
eukprot:TRINITY_DN72018_c0_g2_i1.p1 TRINITY_DN72018_c0_g2~~TRINITY_DN72018_c0_g2_i1.p1  ORF type:complete len:178 (+),score=25.28 TRINITY_DN72018_c0_g2_i1:170-703(+)